LQLRGQALKAVNLYLAGEQLEVAARAATGTQPKKIMMPWNLR
jgi:hypothetical protein